MTYHIINTYAKLAPDTLQNKKMREIMRYTGDTGHPLFKIPAVKAVQREVEKRKGKLHLSQVTHALNSDSQ